MRSPAIAIRREPLRTPIGCVRVVDERQALPSAAWNGVEQPMPATKAHSWIFQSGFRDSAFGWHMDRRSLHVRSVALGRVTGALGGP